jgi:hypothetical protein
MKKLYGNAVKNGLHGIIPANTKWFRNFVVAQIIVNTLESMKLTFTKPNFDISKYLLMDKQ